MHVFTIYHNPRCSKSRQALALLKSQNIPLNIVEYLKKPLDLDSIKTLSAHFDLKEFVRYTDANFKALNLSLDDKTRVLETLAENPIFMQRPIVTYGDDAIIARPPEAVLAFIKKHT